MILFGWVIIALFVLNIVLSILTIGKKREPVTPGAAVLTLIFNTLIIGWLLLVLSNPTCNF